MPNAPDPAPAAGAVDPALVREIAELVVSALNLEIAPEEIGADSALYREGLGLDSIDILEVALVISKRYGFKLKEDEEGNARIFASLGSLAAHVAEHRTR
jgi:acyl carrier protein